MRLVGRSGLAAALRTSETSARSWQRAGLFAAALVVDGRELFDLDDQAVSSLVAQRAAAPHKRLMSSAEGQAAA
jgi:hypothetical protein